MSRNKPNNNRVYSVPGTLRQITAKEKSFAGGPMNLRPGSRDPALGLVGGGLVPGLQRGAARPRAGGGEGEGDGEVAADGGAERARGAGDLSTRTTCAAAGVASSGGRGRASSAAAYPSLGGRTPISFIHHGPPPAYAHGREAVGGAEAWPQVHPPARRRGSCAGHAWRCVRLFLPEIYVSFPSVRPPRAFRAGKFLRAGPVEQGERLS
jgi:hypothetical protein